MSAIVGYLFHAGPVPAVPWFRSMALHTASCLILLQVAGLALLPEREPIRSLISRGGGPGHKGWLLLGVTVLPVLLALPLLTGMRVGLFDAPFTMALLVVVLMAVQTFILWQDNLALERAQAGRLQAEQVLLQTEKLAVVGRLAASIAHEINNPLEAVGNLLYLIGSAESLPEVAGYVRTAEDELARASQITTQTLSFYRDDRKKTVCSPQNSVESAVKLLSSKIQAAGVTDHRWCRRYQARGPLQGWRAASDPHQSAFQRRRGRAGRPPPRPHTGIPRVVRRRHQRHRGSSHPRRR